MTGGDSDIFLRPGELFFGGGERVGERPRGGGDDIVIVCWWVGSEIKLGEIKLSQERTRCNCGHVHDNSAAR